MEINALLKSKNYKVTPARISILELFYKNKKPLSADCISKKVLEINKATIFRNLSSFEKSGIIKRVDLRKESIHFELNNDHHHHLICSNCGKIKSFYDSGIEKALKKFIKKSNFKVSDHSLEFFGHCHKC
ncbi:MAG: Fur family transcriptional regulator [Patescibacteria group bacterium]|nr:Fur family transcriptional regulator [Patescibacteria group bacterium]